MAAMPQVSHLAGDTFLQFWKDGKKGPSVCHTSRLSVFFFFLKCTHAHPALSPTVCSLQPPRQSAPEAKVRGRDNKGWG